MDLLNLVARLTLDSSDYEEGLGKAKEGAGEFSEQWEEAKDKFATGGKKLATGIGLLGGLGTAAFKSADALSQNLDNIDKSSQKIGFSAKAYQEWDFVLQHSGSSIDEMTMGIKTLTNKYDSLMSGNKEAAETFGKLGLSMEDVKGLSQEDLFAKVIYGLQGMEEGAERSALASDLLGRSGMALGPLLNTTAEDTQAMIKQVNDLGGIMSDDAVKSGAAFADSLQNVKTAFAGAGAKLLEDLLPAITTLMDKISEFVSSGKLDNLLQTLKDIAPVVAVVVAGIAGFQIVSGIISLIQGLSVVFGILNAVMAANPIGIIIIAIAALVAAFVALWNNCEGFRQFWIDAWEGIKNFAIEAWEAIKNAFAAVGEWFTEKFQAAKDGIMNAWSNIKEKFSEKWERIKEAFSATKQWFSDRFSEAKEKAANAWSDVKQRFSDRWSEIKSAFQNPKGWFTEKFREAKENAVAAWDNIKSLMSGVWEKIKSAFSFKDALNWGKDMIQNFIDGITAKWQALKDKVSGVARTVKSFLGFSEPEQGPLSDFHTYAPDMMMLFAKGIKDNEKKVRDQLEKSFNFDRTLSADSLLGDAASGHVTPAAAAARNYSINVTINGSEGQDVRTLADLVAERISFEIQKREAALT